MMRPDDAMEKVLAGLRDVEAPAGMERRILERLEGSATVRARGGWRAMWVGRPWVGVALGCGIVAAVIAVVLVPVGHRNVKPNEVGAKALVGREVVVGSAGKRQIFAGTPLVPERKQVRVEAAQSVSQGDEDSVAMSEMRAASFPAPPMPLTEQERLLLRMVHKGGPVELAMLDPRMEEMREAEEKAEFQRFFAKAVVKEPEATVDHAAPQGEDASPVETPAQEPKEQSTKQVSPEVTVEPQ